MKNFPELVGFKTTPQILRYYRPVDPGCAMAHPDFGRSVNPISTRGDRLCPPNYYWHTRIFRPSDGPGAYLTPIYSRSSERKKVQAICL